MSGAMSAVLVRILLGAGSLSSATSAALSSAGVSSNSLARSSAAEFASTEAGPSTSMDAAARRIDFPSTFRGGALVAAIVGEGIVGEGIVGDGIAGDGVALESSDGSLGDLDQGRAITPAEEGEEDSAGGGGLERPFTTGTMGVNGRPSSSSSSPSSSPSSSSSSSSAKVSWY
jgi:hypothetical protein